jgi:hypothetical protein
VTQNKDDNGIKVLNLNSALMWMPFSASLALIFFASASALYQANVAEIDHIRQIYSIIGAIGFASASALCFVWFLVLQLWKMHRAPEGQDVS